MNFGTRRFPMVDDQIFRALGSIQGGERTITIAINISLSNLASALRKSPSFGEDILPDLFKQRSTRWQFFASVLDHLI